MPQEIDLPRQFNNAIRTGNLDQVRKMVEEGFDVNRTFKVIMFSVEHAVICGFLMATSARSEINIEMAFKTLWG